MKHIGLLYSSVILVYSIVPKKNKGVSGLEDNSFVRVFYADRKKIVKYRKRRHDCQVDTRFLSIVYSMLE
jgi:hypothetical protein